jgi:hypothetical protein
MALLSSVSKRVAGRASSGPAAWISHIFVSAQATYEELWGHMGSHLSSAGSGGSSAITGQADRINASAIFPGILTTVLLTY